MSTQNFFDALGESGKLKHELLRQYLPTWMKILGRNFPSGMGRTMHYLDTHAGPGRYLRDGAMGSPLIAIEAAEGVRAAYPDLNFSATFIDVKPEHVDALNSEISALRFDRGHISAVARQGDFELVLPKLLESIPASEALFVFVDPFGYSVPMKTVRRVLAGRRYAEVFLTLMSNFMARFTSDETKAATRTEVVGSEDWRPLLGRPRVEELIVNLYCRNVMADPVGARPSTAERLAYPIKINPAFAKDVYYLIHVSHAPIARKTMEGCARAAFGEVPMPVLFPNSGAVDIIMDAVTKVTTGIRALATAGMVWRREPFLNWDPDIRFAMKHLHFQGSLRVMKRQKDGTYVPRKVGTEIVPTDMLFPAD